MGRDRQGAGRKSEELHARSAFFEESDGDVLHLICSPPRERRDNVMTVGKVPALTRRATDPPAPRTICTPAGANADRTRRTLTGLPRRSASAEKSARAARSM